jgi:hypothetical protein
MFRKVEKALLLASCLAVIWAFATLPSYADDWNKATKITVNQPFEIPGMILPAGTYMVKLVDLAAERHVVRFLSEDESKVYATLIAIPNYRLEPTDKTSITFYESEVGRPRALHEWFYPGHLSGVEFVYPEKRATEIAAVSEEHVIATKGPEFVPFIEEKQPEPAPTVKELLTEPLVEVKPGGEETEIAAVTPEPTPVPETPAIPKTATPFPLVALIGLLAAGGASGLRLLRHSG